MKNYRSLLVLSAFFISEITFGQFTLTGKVVDSASREPLYGASVFCQNTTSGTITNKEGGFSLQLKAGGYELIISFTGYQTREIRISNNDNGPLQIELVKEEKTMGEVVIRSSNEVTDGWNKYGKFFLALLQTPCCVLCKIRKYCISIIIRKVTSSRCWQRSPFSFRTRLLAIRCDTSWIHLCTIIKRR